MQNYNFSHILFITFVRSDNRINNVQYSNYEATNLDEVVLKTIHTENFVEDFRQNGFYNRNCFLNRPNSFQNYRARRKLYKSTFLYIN